MFHERRHRLSRRSDPYGALRSRDHGGVHGSGGGSAARRNQKFSRRAPPPTCCRFGVPGNSHNANWWSAGRCRDSCQVQSSEYCHLSEARWLAISLEWSPPGEKRHSYVAARDSSLDRACALDVRRRPGGRRLGRPEAAHGARCSLGIRPTRAAVWSSQRCLHCSLAGKHGRYTGAVSACDRSLALCRNVLAYKTPLPRHKFE